MKYYLIAGEASGDLHGANLIKALRELDPKAQFRFWGGDLMAASAGDTPVRHIRDLAIMGFIEVVSHLGTVLGNIRCCKKDILEYHPDVVIGIDYPGFNLKVENWAHKQGFKTVHYISPNLWAWKKGRIKGMKKSLDLLCYILPFEQHFFAENNMQQALYVGHPLLDAVKNSLFEPAFHGKRHVIALLPGSRRQELKKSLPLMVQLANRHPEYRFIVAGMSLLGEELYRSLIPEGSNVDVVYDQTYPLLASAYAAVVCSGTATLETALFNVPQVVCYRANPISIAIARAIVSRRIHYISLVNLIADNTIVTELIQNDLTPTRLEQEFQLITTDDSNRIRMFIQYAQMRELLAGSGASHRTAQAIIDLCK
ncbi:MAG: lipid-A-disaccharide synthase [Bacteroidales bacterium]|nr:lipid-A-disaccharide synthase [Bacteroidales bacterium]